MADYKLVVLSNAAEGRDDDYNEWYSKQHLNDVLNVPGFYRAQRMTVVNPLSDEPPAHKYMAIYEFESDDLAKTFGYFFLVTNTDKMPISDAMDRDAVLHVVRIMGDAVERSAPTPWPAA